MSKMIQFMCSEVDPTGSLWYILLHGRRLNTTVLKLTLPGHYGIMPLSTARETKGSEVDPTGSLWYNRLRFEYDNLNVLKLTLPGHYGIKIEAGSKKEYVF